MLHRLNQAHTQIKTSQPLVLCLTNYVTMDFMANSLLALGAAPLMSEAIEEVEELVAISQALYINIGTLNSAFIQRALLAAQIAQSLKKPIILDPVGAGASMIRTTTAKQFIPFATVIRGNASEIMALSIDSKSTKGVETVHGVDKAVESAKQLAMEFNKTIVISGPTDFITDGSRQATLPFGSLIMPRITGMGCTMTAVLSAFAALNSDSFEAAIHASAYYGLCGQYTEKQTQKPGTFRQVFIDTLYTPDWDYFTAQYAYAEVV